MPSVNSISDILAIMKSEAQKRNAPVFIAESTKKTPFQMLVFVMLSARTKDDRTINAVKKLFAVAGTPEKIAGLSASKLETLIYGVGFYRVKAGNLIKMCKMLVKKFKCIVPGTLNELLLLPGIGRKSANIVLANCFGKRVIGVDTHVHRISNRLGLVRTKKRNDTESLLMKKIPSQYLRKINRIFVAYGQTICVPVSPFCSMCKLKDKFCPRIGVKTSR